MEFPAGLDEIVPAEALATFERAHSYSAGVLKAADVIARQVLKESGIQQDLACVAVIGSVGRHEAMEASDLDILPIWAGDASSFDAFNKAMEILRTRLRQDLGMDVSSSRDLMRCATVSELSDPETIGGDKDDRRKLTQRIGVLTEASHVGGDLQIDSVRRRLLEAYVGDQTTQRTASRHPLAACNDIARYFRTVCVDHKSRAESKPESWCLRHTKLRGARKFWYFSTLIAVCVAIADIDTSNHPEVFARLVAALSDPPIVRLYKALADTQARDATGRLLAGYADYIREMSQTEIREALNAVVFEKRLSEQLADGRVNPFPRIYASSQDLHSSMLSVLEQVSPVVRRKVMDWFFL